MNVDELLKKFLHDQVKLLKEINIKNIIDNKQINEDEIVKLLKNVTQVTINMEAVSKTLEILQSDKS